MEMVLSYIFLSPAYRWCAGCTWCDCDCDCDGIIAVLSEPTPFSSNWMLMLPRSSNITVCDTASSAASTFFFTFTFLARALGTSIAYP